MRIQQLSTALANHIAAGEVVERPASVVKELLENAIDANANNITLTIESGGIGLVSVRDDGDGIHPDDLHMAFMPHATSKIHSLDDLGAIAQLGFRGEALASISCVSRTSIISCQRELKQAYGISGMPLTAVSMKAHPIGTTVIVRDLFYNTPARRKFLRSERTEWLQIETLFKRIALSQMAIGFKLIADSKIIFQLPPATTQAARSKRVSKILGEKFLHTALYIESSHQAFSLQGWLSSPDYLRNAGDKQYCFLNGRVVRDKLIQHAIKTAYEETCPPGNFPACVLMLTCNPEDVDVNVHPTKHEVRFRETRMVHDFLVSRIRQSLGSNVVQQPTLQTTSYPRSAMPTSQAQLTGIIGGRYALGQIDGQASFIDIKLLLAWLVHTQSQAGLSARQLCIPVSIPGHYPELAKALRPYGIQVEPMDANQSVVRSLPNILSQLDLKGFFIGTQHTLPEDMSIALANYCEIHDPQELAELLNAHQALGAPRQDNRGRILIKPIRLETFEQYFHA